MDFTLSLMIFPSDLDKAGLEEVKVFWGNEELHQDPKKYKYNQLKFTEIDERNYLDKYVFDKQFLHESIELVLDIKQAFEIERKINYLINEIYDEEISIYQDFTSLIEKLYVEVDRFMILKIIEDIGVKEQYKINDFDHAFELLFKSIDRRNPKALLIEKSYPSVF